MLEEKISLQESWSYLLMFKEAIMLKKTSALFLQLRINILDDITKARAKRRKSTHSFNLFERY